MKTQLKSSQEEKRLSIYKSQNVMKVIGNYRYDLNDQVGSGFSSNVYRGYNTQNQELVAIKVIDLSRIDTPISKTLLKNEIQVLRQINHNNLLKVHDIYLTQNNTLLTQNQFFFFFRYIISEFCESGDLADLIAAKKRIPEKEAIELLNQILSGMKELQIKQIIHRDIKPANILIHNGVPKLADFGFAINENAQLDQSILRNFNVGTPLYMAPETILYNQYSEKSDVWALGVVFYEMLHGFPPYKAPSDSSLLNLYLTTPVSFSQSTSISKDFRSLIQNMLMIDQNYRYSTDKVIETVQSLLKQNLNESHNFTYEYNSQQSQNKITNRFFTRVPSPLKIAPLRPTRENKKRDKQINGSNQSRRSSDRMPNPQIELKTQPSAKGFDLKLLDVKQNPVTSQEKNQTTVTRLPPRVIQPSPYLKRPNNIYEDKDLNPLRRRKSTQSAERSERPLRNNTAHLMEITSNQFINNYNRKTDYQNIPPKPLVSPALTGKNADSNKKREYFRSITPDNREFRKISNGSQLPNVMFSKRGSSNSRDRFTSLNSEKNGSGSSQNQPLTRINQKSQEKKPFQVSTIPKVHQKQLDYLNNQDIDLYKNQNLQGISKKYTKQSLLDLSNNKSRNPTQPEKEEYESTKQIVKDLKNDLRLISSSKNPLEDIAQKYSYLNDTNLKRNESTYMTEPQEGQEKAKFQRELENFYQILMAPKSEVFSNSETSSVRNQIEMLQSLDDNFSKFSQFIDDDILEEDLLDVEDTKLCMVYLCKFMKSVVGTLGIDLNSSISTNPPSSKSFLSAKLTFLLWKCMAIKCYIIQEIPALEKFAKRIITQFSDHFNQIQSCSYSASLISDDRRFEVLFDQQVEDDCSGFYAILLHYIGEMIKLHQKNSMQIEKKDVLSSKLNILQTLINDQLQNFNQQEVFAMKCLTKLRRFYGENQNKKHF